MSDYIAGDELEGDEFVVGDADILGRIARRVAANLGRGLG
jgi:hypothetical protein